MRPVERQEQRVHRIEVSTQEAFPFLCWFHIDDFPAGPFTVASAIIGGVSNYWTGNLALRLLSLQQPVLLFCWIIFGIALGIAVAIKFINWLIDHSPD